MAVSRITPVPALFPCGTRQACPLPTTGKYWGWRLGDWCKVEVTALPEGGGTGCLVYAPRDRRGYPWHRSAAVQDCQAFFGPVSSWGDVPPKVSRRQLQALGLSK